MTKREFRAIRQDARPYFCHCEGIAMILEVLNCCDGVRVQTYEVGAPDYEAEMDRLARLLGRDPVELRDSLQNGGTETTSSYLYRITE